jgi:nicotinamidase-related amidase
MSGREAFEARYRSAANQGFEDPQRLYSDLTIVIHSRDEEPADDKFLNVLKRYYPGAALVLVEHEEGTWRRLHLKNAQKSEFFSSRASLRQSSTKSASNSGSKTICENPLSDALRNCKTGSVVVMSGSSRHPAERVIGMLEEIRRGFEFVVSADFSCAYGGNASEECESLTELFFARLKLKRKGFEVSDPFSRFYAGNTKVVQAALQKVPASRRESSGNLLFELLKKLPKDVEFLQMHHAEFFSPGFIASKHLNPSS